MAAECLFCDEIATNSCLECGNVTCSSCLVNHRRSSRNYVFDIGAKLIRPFGLCLSPFGQLLVTETSDNCVFMLDRFIGFYFSFGSKGHCDGKLNFPAGICVDMCYRIIVVDQHNHRVQIFDSQGEFLLKFGSYGKEYGQFEYPRHVAVDMRGRIVVADSLNHRIQQFDSEGRFMRQFTFEGLRRGIAIPSGVCYTPKGNIIVSDIGNHCLYLINPDENQILLCRGHKGSSRDAFNEPVAISCDGNGRVLVGDSRNRRLLVCCSETLNCLETFPLNVYTNSNPQMKQYGIHEKDRISDVTWTTFGHMAFLTEPSPDSEHSSSSYKTVIHYV